MKHLNLNNYKKIIPSQKNRLRILNILKFIPDSLMIRIQYWIKLKSKLNLNNPQRFTEKLQWYKIFYQKSLMQKCSDKFQVREYVKSKGLKHILNDLYGVYKNPNEVPFNDLPKKCIIKTTNSSGTNIFFNDKIDTVNIKNKLNLWMKQNLYISGREWCYKEHEPKIIVEKLLEDKNNSFHGISDYKFFCFQGKAQYIVLDVDRFVRHRRNFYDIDWNYLDISSDHPNFGDTITKPNQLDNMIEIANTLSADFPFVRVDLYLVESKIIFGELTFYPWSGYVAFNPDNFDFILGEKFILPIKPKRK